MSVKKGTREQDNTEYKRKDNKEHTIAKSTKEQRTQESKEHKRTENIRMKSINSTKNTK